MIDKELEAVIAQRVAEALERSAIGEMELRPEDLVGLSASQAMSLQRKILFLRAFSRRGIIMDGCTASGMSRNGVSAWRDRDAWFEELYQAAIQEACDNLEAEAFRRAVDGVDEPVVFQGMPTTIKDATTGEERIFTIKKYSDPLLVLLLKGNKPDKYRENVNSTHSFEGQTGVLMVPGPVDPEAWAKAAREQQAKYAGNTGEGNDG